VHSGLDNPVAARLADHTAAVVGRNAAEEDTGSDLEDRSHLAGLEEGGNYGSRSQHEIRYERRVQELFTSTVGVLEGLMHRRPPSAARAVHAGSHPDWEGQKNPHDAVAHSLEEHYRIEGLGVGILAVGRSPAGRSLGWSRGADIDCKGLTWCRSRRGRRSKMIIRGDFEHLEMCLG